jgi:hypothetical protein
MFFFLSKKKTFHPHYTYRKQNIDETIISRLKIKEETADLGVWDFFCDF